MSRPVCVQRRVEHRGRQFHFVSYDGQPTNAKRFEPSTTPAWWLMSGGKRFEVMPFHPGMAEAELDCAFTAWLDAHVFRSPDEIED